MCTSSVDKSVQRVCTPFFHNTYIRVPNIVCAPRTEVYASEVRDGKVSQEPCGYRKVRSAGGTENGTEGMSSRTPCTGEYNQRRQETHGGCDPRLSCRHHYTEMCRNGEETQRADESQLCGAASQCGILREEDEVDSRWPAQKDREASAWQHPFTL